MAVEPLSDDEITALRLMIRASGMRDLEIDPNAAPPPAGAMPVLRKRSATPKLGAGVSAKPQTEGTKP